MMSSRSGISSKVNYDNVKRFSRKSSDCFAFKVNAGGRAKDGDKISCLHCNKQFKTHCWRITFSVWNDWSFSFKIN